ncbi:MAG: hypothetical protein AB9819_01115 [Methanomassiliicoccales archaeon]
MGNIVANALIAKGLGDHGRNFNAGSTDYDTYEEMGKDIENRKNEKLLEGTIFNSSNIGTRPNTSEYFIFFMILGALGLLMWAGSKIVTYYALLMPTIEEFDYDYFKYGQAMERYVDMLYATDAWGLFLTIFAIIGVLTLIINELPHRRQD